MTLPIDCYPLYERVYLQVSKGNTAPELDTFFQGSTAEKIIAYMANDDVTLNRHRTEEQVRTAFASWKTI